MCFTETLKLYLNSPFKGTQDKMSAMSEKDLEFVNKVYSWAEKNYAKGGQWIVECLEPWAVLEQFKSVPQAKEYAGLIQDQCEDAQAEAF